jgi:hypothetical protein
MTGSDDRQDEVAAKRARARRTALFIAVIAVLIYVGFIVFGGGLLK